MKPRRRAIICYRYLDDLEAALEEAEQLRVAALETPRPGVWVGAVRGLTAAIHARRGESEHADPGLESVEDAKVRLAQLKSEG